MHRLKVSHFRMSWCGGGLVVEPSEVERMRMMEDRIEEVQPDNSVLDGVTCARAS